MSDQSPNLSLPYLMPSQAQKHVTHNEAIQRLDALVQLCVQSFDAVDPPLSPTEGQVYSVGSDATGAWAGQDGQLAWQTGTTWAFIPPQEGWRAWGLQEQALRVYSGSQWFDVRPPLDNLNGVGVGTGSDATNRLAVASPAALFTHAGSDHRLTINKAGSADTASIVFQSAWSGRAEFGLAGDEDFHVRVSPDGTNFSDAFKLRRADGTMEAYCLMSGSIEIADDAVGIIQTPGVGGMVALNLVHDQFPQPDHSGLLAYDTGTSLALTSLAVGSNLDALGSTDLTGTTGVDGKTSVAVRARELMVENRHGSAQRFAFTFLNTY